MTRNRMANALVLAVLLLAVLVKVAVASEHRLIIPALGFNQALASSLDYGPWMYYHDGDTIAIAGHDVTHQRTFHYIMDLKHGDKIFLTGVGTFVVQRHQVVPSWNDQWVLNYRGMVLSSCWPRGSAAYRWVVFARFIGR